MDRESPSNHLHNFFCVFYLYTWNDLNTQLYNIQAKAILLLSIYRIGFQRVEWNVWANERASKHTSNLLQKHNTKGNSLWRSNLNVVHCDHNVSSGVCFTLVAFVPWFFFSLIGSGTFHVWTIKTFCTYFNSSHEELCCLAWISWYILISPIHCLSCAWDAEWFRKRRKDFLPFSCGQKKRRFSWTDKIDRHIDI